MLNNRENLMSYNATEINETTKSAYKMYSSTSYCNTRYKDIFEDGEGYPNQKAYDDFSRKINSDASEFFLACINIDLKPANSINYAYGNYVLRKFINGIRDNLDDCYAFRIQSNKFNVFIKTDKLDDFIGYIKQPNQYCNIYCGLIEEPYVYEKDYELIQKGIALMYQDKFSRINRNNKKNNMICGNKGNTPVELQETELRKYRKTMWYATIGLKVKSPVYKESTIYVYPTRLGHPLETIPILVVIDDMLKYRVEYGKDVKFGIGGTMFSVNARFTREGHLNVSFFKDSEGDEKNYDYTITKTEGECIPANFGKRIGKDEIYPIKKNIQGGCDYVLFKNTDAESNHEPQIVTSGVIEIDNIKYGVYMDELSIDLIPIE